MAAGLGVLRLAPEAFWSMTPRELDAALSAMLGPAGTPLSRGELVSLIARYPDPPSSPRERERTAKD
ncbi:MAG TPA: rcc01693 family protein [Hyphomicrobiaceae bacterium]|nr:rcc01693 family protein [Hyphomicrobiaceae bacterium]